jgi:phosphoribosylamine--glycine ligase
MASEGYPARSKVGRAIHGLDTVPAGPELQVFHAGTARKGDEVVTSGGRVLGVTALGDDAAAARDRAYEALAGISFQGAHWRRDIAR